MNIVSMGMKYFGPAIAGKVASMLGIKSPMVAQLVAAALPTVLSMLTGKAASGQGAQALMQAVQGQSAVGPDDLDAMLSQQSPEQLASSGGGLADLLGGDMDGLVGALGKFGGLPESSTKSMLGLIGPAALGSLKTQVTEQGLDANGLASMLASQKDNIAQAIPQEFAGGNHNAMFGLSGTLGGITDADSATAALPDLEAATGSLDEITDLAGQLPEAAQTGFGGIVGTALSTLQPMIEGAIESSDYGSILKPILEPILAKLAGLAG